MYYLDPFTYLLGALLVFPIWDVQVQCKPEEYGLFDPPSGQTCGQYLDEFLTYATGYLNNPVSAAIRPVETVPDVFRTLRQAANTVDIRMGASTSPR
jgi:ABC-type multidrug transport system permease subunit